MFFTGSMATVFFVVNSTPDLTTIPGLSGVLHPIGILLLALLYVFRYVRDPHASELFKTAVLGALLFGSIFLLSSVLIIWGQETQGVQLATPRIIILTSTTGGGLFGLVVGHLYGRGKIHRKEEQSHRQRLEVLNRVLRHNIRNELNIAQGNLELLSEELPESGTDELRTAIKALNRLETTAELARNAQENIEAGETGERDLTNDLQEAIAEVRATTSCDRFTIDIAESELSVTAIDGVSDALAELIENACKHGSGDVEISLFRTADRGVVEIADDGPGIPEHELEIIESGEETQLTHASGLGLWFSNWVVEKSNGDIEFDTDDGTTVTLSFKLGEKTDQKPISRLEDGVPITG
ncbi:sensor histidine kinase [Haloarchaeobius iranensis]|uniref:histidine kinase n=1 Tax=Haloarchaeobius iranensis TaxID=996166 RepID=A0A1G9WLB0_9EURY|nr:HAMP domain-containing sensor histidine kinase [Haloarchaeobius iranensis]SDM85328.1 Signal transduction histidine kinase [Haloarchaeobius iranensis]